MSENLSKPTRIKSIDRFRGIAIALMIMFGAAKQLSSAPVFLLLSTHDVNDAFLILNGFCFYDIIAPFFIFASGLSFNLSLNTRNENGLRVSATKSLRLIGLGSFFFLPQGDPLGFVFLAFTIIAVILLPVWLYAKKKSLQCYSFFGNFYKKYLKWLGVITLVVAFCETAAYVMGYSDVPSSHWSVLSSIGFSMLFAILFNRYKPEIKIIFCFFLIALYYNMNLYIPAETFSYFTHGGMLGSLGWAILFLIADIAISLRRIKPSIMYLFASCLSVIAFISYRIITPSKAAVNLSYILISTTFSFALWAITELFDNVNIGKYDFLSIAGKNSLFLYIIHTIFMVPMGTVINALVVLTTFTGVLAIILNATGLIAYFIGLCLITDNLNKKGFRFRL